MPSDCGDVCLPTHFAPAERAAEQDLRAAQARLAENPLAVAVLDALPHLVMVLNRERQIIAVNRQLLEALGLASVEAILGLRPGELVSCVRAEDGPGGCGTGPSCSVCGAVNAILTCQETRQPTDSECRLRTKLDLDGGALDLGVHATPLQVGGWELVLLDLRDIGAEKRRGVLERVFFHDVLNIAAGLYAVGELLGEETGDPAEEEYRADLRRMVAQLNDEIVVQRQLLAAERGDLQPSFDAVTASGMLESVAELYRHHTVARGRTLVVGACPEVTFETDPTLLRRVLGNLTKNALEATASGGTITLEAERQGDNVVFHVRNPGVIPDEVQKQIFQRSFSTKGQTGRGIGTHSVKLLTDRYLGGRVEFVSREPEGTVFTVVLPQARPPS